MASVRRINGPKGTAYKITVSSGRTTQGKQVRHYKTWRPDPDMTPKQADRELRRVAYEFEQQVLYGFQPDNKQTFAEYCNYYLEIMETKGARPSTLDNARRILADACQYIGGIKLQDIRPNHLNELYKKLGQRPGEGHKRSAAIPKEDFNKIRGKETYKSFGDRCGVGETVIYKLMNGREISANSAQKIEKSLNLSGLFKYIQYPGAPLSVKTIQLYQCFIYGALKQAKKDMIIPYNPAEMATLPANKKGRVTEILQPEEFGGLFNALKSESIQFRAIVTMLIVTGCRRGEILGLEWDCVDFERQEIYIKQSLNQTKTKGVYIDETKTGVCRYIAIPKEAIDLLKAHKAEQSFQAYRLGDMWSESNLVFTAWDGSPIKPATLNTKIRLFCKRHGLKHIHPHVFRHTAATVLLSNGVEVLTVANMLGHSDMRTTTGIYAHEIASARKITAECISDVILKNNA